MFRGPFKSRHWLVLAGFLIAVAAVAFLWSSPGLGRPSPSDLRASTAQIGARAAREREAGVTLFTLQCLDSLTKAKAADAVRQCSLALALDPNNVTALNLRGSANILDGHSDKAIIDYSRAIALAPDSPDAFRFRGHVYAALHRDALALTDYDRAVALSPGEPLAVEVRGHFYQTRGHYGSAIADFSRVIALSPQLARAWNSRCWTRVIAGIDLAAALADCDESVRLDPLSANAWDSRGFVFVRLAKYAGAIPNFDRALKLKPLLASALFGRGLAKLGLQDPTAARDIALAQQYEPGIEARFASYGITVRVKGPPGT